MSWNHIHLLQHLNTGCQYSGTGQTVFWVPEKTLKTTLTWINSAHFLSWPFSYNFIFPRIASRIILLLSTPCGNIPSFLELWPRWLTLLQKSGGSLWSSVLKLRVDTFPGPSSTHCSDSRPWPNFFYIAMVSVELLNNIIIIDLSWPWCPTPIWQNSATCTLRSCTPWKQQCFQLRKGF